MNEIKLIDLINKIINEMDEPWIKSDVNDFTTNWMLKRLNIVGESNDHIPMQKDVYAERKEEDNNLLTGNEIIRGEYLVYYCVGHTGGEAILEYDTLSKVEEFILRHRDNDFMNMILVFQDGRIKEWEVNGPPNTSEIVSREIIDDIYRTKMKTTIHAKVNWIN